MAREKAKGAGGASLLSGFRMPVVGLALLSAAVNILYLTGSFFMLEIYDRVIPSRSIPTLIGLCVIAAMLYAFQGLLDSVRGRIFLRVGSAIDARLGPRVFSALAALPLKAGPTGDGLPPLRDLDSVRTFIASSGPQALFDLPWIPLYLIICWAFHPLIGFAVLVGALLLFGLALLSEALGRAPAKRAAAAASKRIAAADSVRRNAEVVRALGMASRLNQNWEETSAAHRHEQQRASDISLNLGGLSKMIRMVLQSGVLALGAWLVINQEATAGIIIASSILSARALAPVELAIGNWKGFVSARQSWARLGEVLQRLPEPEPRMALPSPTHSLTVAGLFGTPPSNPRAVVQDVGFTLKAGQGLGIIGPSGSGKSSLARLLVGVWEPVRGTVRLDAAALDQWDPDDLGRHIGYLPQDVELFGGSIANNIARFDKEAKPDRVIAAAKAAGVHDLILSMPDGYSTPIGEGGMALSAGQRQRIALARALFADPFLVVLDEPNSNLDNEGEQALTQAILGIRARGGIVIVIAHRPSALAGVDLLLAMAEGKTVAFGPKEEVLARVLRPTPAPLPAAANAAGPRPVRSIHGGGTAGA